MTNSKSTRRKFLKQSVAGVGAAAVAPNIFAAPGKQESKTEQVMRQNSKNVVLFQGDSITDGGRDKRIKQPNNYEGLGRGYAFLAAAQLLGENAAKDWQCFNRGISGNKVFQLAERWQKDCLDLEPDVVSILIGVNDFWHTLTHDYKGTVEIYENDLRTLLEHTKKVQPNVAFIIGEPFTVTGGSHVTDDWFPAFNDYRAASKRIAKDFKATFIPYQSIFDNALKKAPADYWAPDGVHPSIAGSYLMTQAWLRAFKKTI